MKRFALTIVLSLLLAAPAAADSVRDAIEDQLEDQGFDEIKVSRTLLGRLRFEAANATHLREIVINPVTGEILRDYTVRLDGTAAGPTIIGRRKVDDDDRDDKKVDDDDRDDDDDRGDDDDD